MASKKKLYIHIGTHKTGTTALQYFFCRNRELFKKYDITYPMAQDRIAHHQLALSLVLWGGENIPPVAFRKNLRTCEKESEELIREFDTDVILVSSEYFYLIRKKNTIAKIRELFQSFEVKIIIYLRRLDDFVLSWYNQGVKGLSFATSSVEVFLQDGGLDFVDYGSVLKNWSDMFGKKNIIVRPYEKEQFYDGTIFSDFLHSVFNLELTDAFVLPKSNPNLNLHRVALEYKRLINHLPLSNKEKLLFVRALRNVSVVLRQEGRFDCGPLSPQKRIDLIEWYAETDRAIAKEYLGREEGELFYSPPPDLSEKWKPRNELQEDDAYYINRFLAENYPNLLMVLIRGLLSSHLFQDADMGIAAKLLLPGTIEFIRDFADVSAFKDQTIADKDRQLAIKDQTIAIKDRNILAYQNELHDVYASKSWRSTAPMRKVGRWIRTILRVN